MSYTVEVDGATNSSSTSLQPSSPLPLMLTNINSMLVPLSSPPATIIVVNCSPTSPGTTSSMSQSSSLSSSCIDAQSSHSSSTRLCPIAPAPTASSTANSLHMGAASSLICRAKSDSALAVQRKTYRCDEPGCGKMYFKNSHLKVHKRVHTGMQISIPASNAPGLAQMQENFMT